MRPLLLSASSPVRLCSSRSELQPGSSHRPQSLSRCSAHSPKTKVPVAYVVLRQAEATAAWRPTVPTCPREFKASLFIACSGPIAPAAHPLPLPASRPVQACKRACVRYSGLRVVSGSGGGARLEALEGMPQ